ncbi:MAG TPA: Mur ligase domain-containing protein, partial [Bacteroidales bacterium]|nr:Mur ligase domain-containing protein [Bacteroidales bacterium]
MKRLDDILENIDVISVKGVTDRDISVIEFDSRKVTKGALFIAVKGYVSDGHNFIPDAIRSGAVAVICEKIPADAREDICWIKTG